MAERTRWFWVGSRPFVRDALASSLGEPAAEHVSAAGPGDTVVVDPLAERAVLATLPFGHAFSGVRALKKRDGIAVYLVIDADDSVGVQLARFALADGVLLWHSGENRLVADELLAPARARRRPSVDELLERLQREAGATGQENSLQRLLRFEREHSILDRLQDPETGLFDGPYATIKIDEEWKRAHRFHQALSLLLIDLGLGGTGLADSDRRSVLADAAGVFLNECRDIDVLARFAPDVFLVLLPGTGPEGAVVLAERIVASLTARLGDRVPLRPAVGVATVPSADIGDRRAFVAVTEACLRKARADGAGGVCRSWQ